MLRSLVDKLEKEERLSGAEFERLIAGRTPELAGYVFEKARKARERYYGKKVFIRGLIEFTNYCRNNCLYCGLRRDNRAAERYRLTEQEILECCAEGHALGFRTFVLQGGEDPFFADELLCRIIRSIKKDFPDCAVTLSLGERDAESYQRFFDAGADRYLLRHETADEEHYARLHPPSQSPGERKRCLFSLKDIGYQVGCGFMVGSPYQTPKHLARDMLFMQDLEPHMVGIGPFIPHHATPFAREPAGTLELTLFMLGLTRLMLPSVLLPSTTALATIDPKGRELGILAGANVVMPNLSPPGVREKYLLYDNKATTGAESAQAVRELKEVMKALGYSVVVDRGDFVPPKSQPERPNESGLKSQPEPQPGSQPELRPKSS
ncbi:MAG: [FeFe] hydrogenase H-cluster radical SAM maturase HydE [Bacillota bacterium]|jgi:biotin synthase